MPGGGRQVALGAETMGHAQIVSTLIVEALQGGGRNRQRRWYKLARVL
jgi:hypothetical protein